ncbi:MAG: hypothetical protein ACR2LL_09065 [Nitrosopumilus sp.]
MQKSGILLIVSGTLIVVGLSLLVLGNQIILEGVSQENGKVSLNQDLTILNNFEEQDTTSGIIAVQVMDFKDNTFSARIINPLGIEIISQIINEETIETEFEILESGTYKLIIDSTSNKEAHVFGAIGPVPDAGKKSIGFISIYVLVIGMIGLGLAGILGIKNKIRSV